MTNLSDNRCFLLWVDSNIGLLHNEGVNGAGSILSLWHKEALCYDRHVVGSDFIAIMGQHLKPNSFCVMINVYVACNISDKVALWEALTNLKSSHQCMAWCLCGDFNAVRRDDERKGIRWNSSKKKEIIGFNRFIETNPLVELPRVGKQCTWYKSDGTAKSRLDRILVSEEWLQIWSSFKQSSGEVFGHRLGS